jgi:propionyl-CoA synthetase
MIHNTEELYNRIHARSLADPEGFWGQAAEEISWHRRWDRVLDASHPPFYRWFQGGMLNTCYNAVDRHVEAGRGEQAAIIHDSPVTGSVQTLSYRELLDQVASLAGALRALGVVKGDRVIIYMPMIPQTLVAMLACARLGAVHSVVFGGFAPHELATRISDAMPRVVISASCGIEPNRVVKYKPMLDAAIDQSPHKPQRCVIFQRPIEKAPLLAGRDVDWNDAVAAARPADPVPVLATDPLYILYTSGTTGKPKGVVRDNGGHAVALKWTMQNFYAVRSGEVFWSASDVGWVVGHSYIVYAPLLHGCTTIVFEGKPVGTPDAGTFWRVIEQHQVPTLFTAPTALRAIKREDPRAELPGKYDLTCFRALFLAGERADPDTVRWAEERLQVPVIDHWWQTETGWAIAGNPLGTHLFPVKYGSATRAMPGYDLRVLGADLNELPRGRTGALFARLPLPPGTLSTLWNADENCRQSYFSTCAGHYQTGDAGFIDEEGYVYVMARTDDIINVAGHRLSTGEMEGILAAHPDVAECAVIGMADPIKGQVPLGFLVLKSGVDRAHDQIVRDVVQMVRDQIGPVADFKRAIVVDRLPKTRSGKVLRSTMQKIADHQDYKLPPTIDDPASLMELAEVLKSPALMLAWGVAPRPDDQGLASEEGTPSEHATGGRN